MSAALKEIPMSPKEHDLSTLHTDITTALCNTQRGFVSYLTTNSETGIREHLSRQSRLPHWDRTAPWQRGFELDAMTDSEMVYMSNWVGQVLVEAAGQVLVQWTNGSTSWVWPWELNLIEDALEEYYCLIYDVFGKRYYHANHAVMSLLLRDGHEAPPHSRLVPAHNPVTLTGISLHSPIDQSQIDALNKLVVPELVETAEQCGSPSPHALSFLASRKEPLVAVEHLRGVLYFMPPRPTYLAPVAYSSSDSLGGRKTPGKSVKAYQMVLPSNKAPTPRFTPFTILETDVPHWLYAERPSGFNDMKRYRWECSNLMRQLPSQGIWVFGYSSRMDILTVFISGPRKTPYHNSLFEFEIYLPAEYPHEPPQVHYVSFGRRLNPNLYEEGKVCLSLLGTWQGRASELWVPEKSSILQLVMSIQGLILGVDEPYYLEPGFEEKSNVPEGGVGSKDYSETAVILSLASLLDHIRRINSPMHKPMGWEGLIVDHVLGCMDSLTTLGAAISKVLQQVEGTIDVDKIKPIAVDVHKLTLEAAGDTLSFIPTPSGDKPEEAKSAPVSVQSVAVEEKTCDLMAMLAEYALPPDATESYLNGDGRIPWSRALGQDYAPKRGLLLAFRNILVDLENEVMRWFASQDLVPGSK